MNKAIVIGGGIIGLSSAFYLKKSGWEVTVLDKSDFLDNCSYGNCGYICPSHFIPLATPGIVKQGLKWMWNSKSPFYVQPRLDWNLIDWGMKFIKSASPAHVASSAIPLRDIALISQHAYESWRKSEDFDFAYEHKGLLEIFQTQAGAEHAKHTVERSHEIGLTDTRYLSQQELFAMEPHTRINGIGAILFNCDAHCYPNRLMSELIDYLKRSGVKLLPNEEVINMDKVNRKISSVITTKGSHQADLVVMAAGSWSRTVAAMMDLKLPLMPGRGYSVTLENSPFRVNYPAVLVEGRAAITPMDGNKIRFGGTMEITSHKTPMRMNRVQGVLDAVKRFYPDFDVPMPAKENIWFGYRPCSADGLPYLGRIKKYSNVIVATGHSMLGLSLGAGTGLLVSELANEQKTSMDLKPFEVERFSSSR